MMGIYSKAAFAVLALTLSCSPLLAQGGPQDAPADQQGARDGFGPRGPMGPGGEQGGWGHRRGGFGRDGRRGGRMGGREFGLSRLLSDPAIRQQVGITDEQFATMRKQESDFRKAEIRNRADVEVKRIDLKDLLEADKPDRAAVDAKLQEVSAAQLVMEKSAIDFRLTMREAITPAQREKLRQLMRDRWQREGGRDRKGPGAQGPGRKGQRGSGPAAGAPPPPPND
jgi:Spy/CpxP family protein refolding chaperone